MPTGRTGRQMLYIVWQTSNTPDSYYSCSDLVYKSTATATPTKPPSPAAAKASPVKKTASKAPSSPAPAATKKAAVPVAAAASATTSPAPTPQSLTRVSDEKQGTLGHGIIAGALIIGFGALAWAGFGALRRRRVDNR
jgi:chitin-binding protein